MQKSNLPFFSLRKPYNFLLMVFIQISPGYTASDWNENMNESSRLKGNTSHFIGYLYYITNWSVWHTTSTSKYTWTAGNWSQAAWRTRSAAIQVTDQNIQGPDLTICTGIPESSQSSTQSYSCQKLRGQMMELPALWWIQTRRTSCTLKCTRRIGHQLPSTPYCKNTHMRIFLKKVTSRDEGTEGSLQQPASKN